MVPERPGRGFPCTRDSYCLLCYSNVRGRSNYKGHRKYKAPRKITYWESLMLKRREKPVSGSPGAEAAVSGGWLQKHYPPVWEFLTLTAWEDGAPRECGTILLVCEDGVLKLWLNDKAQGCTAWVSGASLEAAFKAAVAAIEGVGAGWRPTRAAPAKGRR